MLFRSADLDMEIKETEEPPAKNLEDSAVTYLANEPDVKTTLPEAPTGQPIQRPPSMASPENIPEPPQQVTAETSKGTAGEEPDWLARMEAQ